MKNAHKAPQGFQIEKWCHFTITSYAIKFERLLKPFKAVFSGDAGYKFTGFEGGAENA